MITQAKKHVQICTSALCVVSVKGGWGGLELGGGRCVLCMLGAFYLSIVLLINWFQLC